MGSKNKMYAKKYKELRLLRKIHAAIRRLRWIDLEAYCDWAIGRKITIGVDRCVYSVVGMSISKDIST